MISISEVFIGIDEIFAGNKGAHAVLILRYGTAG